MGEAPVGEAPVGEARWVKPRWVKPRWVKPRWVKPRWVSQPSGSLHDEVQETVRYVDDPSHGGALQVARDVLVRSGEVFRGLLIDAGGALDRGPGASRSPAPPALPRQSGFWPRRTRASWRLRKRPLHARDAPTVPRPSVARREPPERPGPQPRLLLPYARRSRTTFKYSIIAAMLVL